MDQRDITPWCRSVKWAQPTGFLEQNWSVTTHAWHLFDVNARYDIYASYDPADPRDTCVIRQGYILPDQRLRVNISRRDQPLITIEGKSYSSHSFRVTPRETLVLVPAPAGTSGMAMAERVLAKYDGPIGRVRVLSNAWDLRRDVIMLGHRACFSVIFHGPNIPMQPVIVPAQLTYWQAILQLIEPYALEVSYSEWFNTLYFIDPVSRPYGRDRISIPGSLLTSLTAAPKFRAHPRRVIVRVPPWP
jgi:hypothetical protein